MKPRHWLSLCAAILALRGLAAAAEIPSHLMALSDAEIDRRLIYLEGVLDEHRTYADWWWKGWTAFYGLGVIIESAEAATTDSRSKRADNIISAVKSAGGVGGQLYRPMLAAKGADPIREIPATTREQRLERLAEAERLLKRRAEQADRRYSLLRHSLNVGINVAGGLIVAEGFHDPSRGWRSAGIGIAVGELMIWSQPWWSRTELEEYEHRFNVSDNRITWRIVPKIGGMKVVVRF